MAARSIGARMRTSLLAVGAAAAASLVLAAPSQAVACRQDGRINGGGSTFAEEGVRGVLVPAFTREVCRYLPPAESVLTDPDNDPNSGSKMVWYNWAGRPTGSSAGVNGAHCRVDAFSFSDLPFDLAQLSMLRGAVPSGISAACAPFQGVNQQFQPRPAPWPAGTDAQAGIIAFPVLGGSIGLGFNLTSSLCGETPPPATIQLDDLQASRLLGGDILAWNDAALVAIQPPGSTLANCGVPVTRVGLLNASGTTTLVKTYLNKADGSRPLCDGTTWSGRLGSAGSNFPSGGSCSPIEYRTGEGGLGGVVQRTADVDGAVGYASVTVWGSQQPDIGLASVRNQADDAYVPPLTGTLAGAQLPAGGALGAANCVGNGWASFDGVYLGRGYPISGFSFMLVRPLGSTPNAISRMTQNQRDTLSAFVHFLLLPTTQAQLGNALYAPIPATFLGPIRSGFRQCYGVTDTP